MNRIALIAASLVALSATHALADEHSSSKHHRTQSNALPSAAFRAEHKEVLLHLGHVKEWAGALATQKADAQRKTALRIVEFFNGHIRPHAESEERTLYPLIDELTDTRKHPFTSSVRHEHRVVGRWIDELVAEVRKDAPDYVAFARRTDNLLGLLWAHFEEEEQVLLPIVDQRLSAEQFEARSKERHPHDDD